MTTFINVHTASDKATTDYVRFMWETMLKLADNRELLRLHIHCIGPSAADQLRSLIQSQTYVVSEAREGGSFGHAACIMDAFKLMIDDEIHIICDSDAFVVAKGWDNLVRLKASLGIGMAGTTYEELGGFSSGTGNVQTYKQIPTFTWAMLGAGPPWNSLNVMPNKDHRILIENDQMSKIYNLPVGHHVFGEAGYQLPLFLHQNNVKYEAWKQLKPSKDAVVLFGLSDYHEEYHVDDVPFVVHHRGSLRHPYRSSKLSKAFFEKVDAWIEQETKRTPRWESTFKGLWKQLSLPFAFEEPPPIRLDARLSIITTDGWLKITSDEVVVRAKSKFNSVVNRVSFTPGQHIHHVRVEGDVNQKFFIEIPDVMNQSVTIRNMTNFELTVQKDVRTATVAIEPGKLAFVLVDADGVFRAT